MHSEDQKQCMPLDIDEIDRNEISSDSSFAETNGRKLLCMYKMVVKNSYRKFFLILHVTSTTEILSMVYVLLSNISVSASFTASLQY